jgi:hypothetical protein
MQDAADGDVIPDIEYPYLGIMHNEILRRKSSIRVEQYKAAALGWETALRVAEAFSEGRRCIRGPGTGLHHSLKSEVQGTFHVCYWVRVEGISAQWVVRFPLMGITSDETTLRQLRSEIATLQFLHRHTNA